MDKRIEKELKEDWYCVGLNAVPLIFEHAASFWMKRYLGYSYTKYMCKYKGKYCEAHYWKNDLERLSKIIIEKMKDNKYLDNVIKIYNAHIGESIRFYDKIDRIDINDLDEKQLFSYAKEAGICVTKAIGVAHLIEPFTLVLDSEVRNMIEHEIKDKKKVNEVFSILISPTKKPFVSEYDLMLYRINREKNREKKNKLAEKTLKRFSWIKNNYAGKELLTKEMVLEDAGSIISINDTDYDKIKKQRKELMKKLKLSERLIFLLNTTSRLADLQDDRKKNLLIAIDYLCSIIDEIEKRRKIEKELLYYMLPKELIDEKIDIGELKRRKKSFVLVQYEEDIIYTTEPEAMKDAINDVKVINGIATSPGTVIGRVKVCKNISQIGKVEKGDILVAPMTRPEYVPAMRKAAAIVTDEGSLTSHASIVARELGIPCIVGTKIATKVLKDNMLVEVKANHGIIEILENG